MHGAKDAPPLTALRAMQWEKGNPPQPENTMNNLPWEIEKIIEVANTLQATGSTGASTAERIAAAFVLNRPDYLPDSYRDLIEAWDRLGVEWQGHVRRIKRDYLHLIERVAWRGRPGEPPMNPTDIHDAIGHRTILRIASLDREARHQALNERKREIAGMIELARLLRVDDALLRFLEREQAYLRDRIEALT